MPRRAKFALAPSVPQGRRDTKTKIANAEIGDPRKSEEKAFHLSIDPSVHLGPDF